MRCIVSLYTPGRPTFPHALGGHRAECGADRLGEEALLGMWYPYRSAISKNAEVRKTVMKFCQARLTPPLIGQIAAEASMDATEEYTRETYEEYTEPRKCLIDGVNRIPGVLYADTDGSFLYGSEITGG